jgi:hypothetical protein
MIQVRRNHPMIHACPVRQLKIAANRTIPLSVDLAEANFSPDLFVIFVGYLFSVSCQGQTPL